MLRKATCLATLPYALALTPAEYTFYISFPIILVMLYMILAYSTWGSARRWVPFFPVYTLLFLFFFPPAFLFFWLWIGLLSFGWCSAPLYMNGPIAPATIDENRV